MQSEVESRCDAEVATASTDRPKQVGMRIGVRVDELAVGGHDVGREQIVDRQTVLADEVADASSESQTTDPDRPRIPEGRCQTMLRGDFRVVAGCDASAYPGRATFDVDFEQVQAAEIQDDPAFARTVPRDAVAPAPDREFDPALTCKRDDLRDVVRASRAYDHRGPAVDTSIENAACVVKAGVSRHRDGSLDARSKLRNRDGSRVRARHRSCLSYWWLRGSCWLLLSSHTS